MDEQRGIHPSSQLLAFLAAPRAAFFARPLHFDILICSKEEFERTIGDVGYESFCRSAKKGNQF
jgi:hypothetical protein